MTFPAGANQIMLKPIDTSTQIFAHRVLLKHTESMLAEMNGVRKADDIESIHRMRVATRRLRNALDLFSDLLPVKKSTRWLGTVKEVTKSLGAARDLDVQMDVVAGFIKKQTERKYLAGSRRIYARLGQSRQKLQKRVLFAMDDAEKSDALIEMQTYFSLPSPVETSEGSTNPRSEYSTALYFRAVSSIFQRLESFLAYEISMYDPKNIKELHAMRIQAKWLRYSLETFAEIYPDQLKKSIAAARLTQEYLGLIHDCDIWADFMPGFIEREHKRTTKYYASEAPFNFLRPGLNAFTQDRAETRQQLYKDFLEQWAKWRKEGIWDRLRLSLTEPLVTPRSSPLSPEPEG
jgi:CHAD domain-containing protein